MRYAERLSFDYIDHTCPIVDNLTEQCLELLIEDLSKIITNQLTDEQIQEVDDIVKYRVNTLIGKVKVHATERLRSALIDCCDDLQATKEERDNALSDASIIESDKDRFESDVEYYKSEVNRLENLVFDLEVKLGEFDE